AGQHILNTALFEAFFTDDIRELGPAILSAKQVLLANGSAEYEKISQTFLLFGDPATALKIPLPRMPTGVTAVRQDNGVRISWNAALDSNGNAVAGYNIYRAGSPAGPYSKINTELVTGTEFIDTGGTVVGAVSAAGGGSTYYAVSSQDDDGDESAPSLGISPAAMGSSSGSGGGGCFIDTVSQSVSKQGLWLVVLLTVGLALCQRVQRFRTRIRLRSGELRRAG
ncbi:MAG: C25 family cysteine peptidase, partial [Desulfobacterales bacterium]